MIRVLLMNEATSALGGAAGPGGWPVAFFTSQKHIMTSNTSHLSSGKSTAI